MPHLKSLAERQLADYDAHNPGQIFDGDAPIGSLAEAYQLQMEVARLRLNRGEGLAGYKIGCVSDVVRRQLHMDRPLFGHVFSSEIHSSGVALDSTAFANLAIEGEFGVRMAQDAPDSDWLREHKAQALASFFPVIELHNYVLRGQQSSVELIANNGLQAGVVLPLEETGTDDLDKLLEEPISVSKNGKLLGQTTAGTIPEGPFGTLCQLADHLALNGIPLKKGQLILTGSPLPLYPVRPDDFIRVQSGRFGEVWMSILPESM